MACSVWYCYSTGHWAKAKKLFLSTSTGHWSLAKAVSYKRTATAYQTCSVSPPVISHIANLTLKFRAAFTINAHVVRATRYVWYYNAAGRGWTIWPGKTTARITGTADDVAMNNQQMKLVASNAYGSVTSNVFTMKFNIIMPTITKQPGNFYSFVGGYIHMVLTAINFNHINWFYMKGGRGSWVAAGGGALSLHGQKWDPPVKLDSSWNNTKVKAMVYNSTGQSVHSIVVNITVR